MKLEPDSAAQEETYYANLSETRALKPAAFPDRDSANQYVAKLDGKQKKLGPSLYMMGRCYRRHPVPPLYFLGC
ncbi:hypothetical protein HNQ91_001996 [Filimonas zeae]|uniref:Uncharacterized protein n=1 Tax=Filimonas zeae TaxID=1737353 RepID=A0A917MV80_9BACT|nr:hypothetical protein [Filimonas zeae]MDR6338945.1 hypothetical protein [Filimonas zeae]GGH65835.1 hypothetical protein GCM10011379_19400 [Filimonas zeae]